MHRSKTLAQPFVGSLERTVVVLVILAACFGAAIKLQAEPVRVVVERVAEPSARDDAPEPAGAQHSCASCHTFAGGTSHPVDIEGPASTPSDLPLVDGLITCLTCHEASASRPHDGRDRPENQMLRRDPETGGLCSACHNGRENGRTSHRGLLTSAHGMSALPTSPFAGSLDAESSACMGCHDGTAATDTGSHTAPMRIGGTTEHPIGVEMRSSSPGRSDGIRLVPANSLDRRIRLFDGRVGCGSCHNVYSGEDKLLVMSNLRSALCVSCHVE